MTLDPLDAVRLAHHEFAKRVTRVTSSDWSLPSACDEWSVGDLVDHVVGGNAFTIEALRGATAAQAMEKAIEVASAAANDRPSAYTETAGAMLELMANSDVLPRIYHHAVGDITGRRVVALRTDDLALHAWDLARSLGLDEGLDPGLVRHVWEHLEPQAEQLAASGRFGRGTSGTVAADAPLQIRLLDLTGRW